MPVVGAFSNHNLTLDDLGNVWAFGDSEYGQCGDVPLGERYYKTVIPSIIPDLNNIVSIGVGGYHSVCIDMNGDIFTFGRNNNGQCGPLNVGNGKTNITKVEGLKNIISVSCGGNFTICIDDNNHVYVFGDNSSGQLGEGEKEKQSKYIPTPFIIDIFNNINIISVQCGYSHSIFMTNGGYVYGCGSNQYGQLGIDDKKLFKTYTPILNPFLSDIIQISCGCYHTMVLTTKNELFSFGYHDDGQLGIDNNSNQYKPHLVSCIPESPILSIECGENHSMILDSDGYVWSCGFNFYGQLGHGDREQRSLFTKISSISNAELISCAGEHSIIKTSHGIYTFGNNRIGQCGGSASKSSEGEILTPTLLIDEYSNIIRGERRFKTTKSARK